MAQGKDIDKKVKMMLATVLPPVAGSLEMQFAPGKPLDVRDSAKTSLDRELPSGRTAPRDRVQH
jgi:hypothetical protein